MNDHELLQAQIASYLLDALDVDESATFERELLQHLPGCAECAALMVELRGIAGELAIVPDPVEASPGLEARIRASIAGDVERVPVASLGARRRMLAVGLVASLLALPVSWGLSLSRRLDDAEQRAAVATQLSQLLADPSTRAVPLKGKTESMTFVFQPGVHGLLLAEGARLAQGKVFQLWFIRQGTPIPSAVFAPIHGRVVVDVPVIPTGAEVVAITVEDGYVSQPTTPPIMAGTLS